MSESSKQGTTARISALYVQIERQILDADGDEISRGILMNNQVPIQVPLFIADIKKIPGLLEVLASKGVKVV